jgi:hypothetical protein
VLVLSMTHHLIIVTICAKYFQNPLIYEDDIDPTLNIPANILCYFFPLSVILNLEVGMQVLRMTHCLIDMTICAKYFQNALIYENVMDRTQNIPYNRLC